MAVDDTLSVVAVTEYAVPAGTLTGVKVQTKLKPAPAAQLPVKVGGGGGAAVIVTTTWPDTAVFAALVAVTVTCPAAESVNSPELDIVPPVVFHVTAVFVVPATVAVICSVWPAATVPFDGVTVTVIAEDGATVSVTGIEYGELESVTFDCGVTAITTVSVYVPAARPARLTDKLDVAVVVPLAGETVSQEDECDSVNGQWHTGTPAGSGEHGVESLTCRV